MRNAHYQLTALGTLTLAGIAFANPAWAYTTYGVETQLITPPMEAYTLCSNAGRGGPPHAGQVEVVKYNSTSGPVNTNVIGNWAYCQVFMAAGYVEGMYVYYPTTCQQLIADANVTAIDDCSKDSSCIGRELGDPSTCPTAGVLGGYGGSGSYGR